MIAESPERRTRPGRDPHSLPLPRVLMVVKRAAGRGGMQQQARRVSLALRRAGVPVTLLMNSSTPMPRGVVWQRRLPTHILVTPNQWVFAAELYRYLVRYREAYDVVHVHGLGLETFAAMAAKRVTGRALVVKPGTAGEGTKLHLYARMTRALPALAALWRQVNAWIAISAQTRADLQRLGLRPTGIAEIPNGVETDRFRPLDPEKRRALRAQYGLTPEDTVIITTARLEPHKRIDLLARAFLDLAPRFPQAHLWILGTGEQLPALEALVAASPHGTRIRLFGQQKAWNVQRALQAADLFALVSLWEGLSNALLEAMACGLPALVTDVSGMKDLVRSGERGLVIPPDDQAATAAGLARLLEDADLRRRLGAAASAHVREEYGLERTTRRLVELYQAIRR